MITHMPGYKGLRRIIWEEGESIATFHSPISGEHTVKFPDSKISKEQFLQWFSGNKLIQEAMPQLTATEREFFLTGFTESEQKEIFGE